MPRASGLELLWRECANGERCRSFDCVSRDETARDFAQDDTFWGGSVRVGVAFGGAGSLEEDEKGEEEEPENTHGMPVPSGSVDEDLAGFELA